MATGTSSAIIAVPAVAAPSPMRRRRTGVVASLYPTAARRSSIGIRLLGHRARIHVHVLHESPAEAALDAEVALGDRILERRCGLHDLTVRDMEPQGATDAAIWTDRVGR